MNVAAGFREHGVEIDDIRWYLAHEEALRVLTYRDNPVELAELIHSGRLEADWYRMEERFVEELQEKIDTRIIDEAEVYKTIGRIEAAKRSGNRR